MDHRILNMHTYINKITSVYRITFVFINIVQIKLLDTILKR